VVKLDLYQYYTGFTNRSEDGREVDSFGTIAQQLGAKSMIASLWSVNDDSTSNLMQTMYRLRQQNQGHDQGRSATSGSTRAADWQAKAFDRSTRFRS
jgi:hypothetical protein